MGSQHNQVPTFQETPGVDYAPRQPKFEIDLAFTLDPSSGEQNIHTVFGLTDERAEEISKLLAGAVEQVQTRQTQCPDFVLTSAIGICLFAFGLVCGQMNDLQEYTYLGWLAASAANQVEE